MSAASVRMLFFCAFVVAANAQTTSTVTGLITDQSNAVVPGAKVVVTAVETGVEYATTSNAEGYYTLPSLQAFHYTVSATADGFKVEKSAAFKLDSSAVARVDLTLVPGDSKQTIDVQGTAATINTENGMLGTTISTKEMEDLPVQGRGALLLLATVPGVGGEMQGDEVTKSLTPMSPGAGVSVGGGRLGTTGYLVDGGNSTSMFYGKAAMTLSTDTVQEMKIITNNYSAQYGSIGSGVVSMVSKSGTDQIHGSAFWYNKNPYFGARTFNSVLPPNNRMNQLGVTVGGPVYLPKIYNGRHKTFFFVSVEPRRWSNISQLLAFVPTEAERQGDFRDEWVNSSGAKPPLLYQQFTCSPSESNCQQLLPVNRPTTTSLYPLMCASCSPSEVGHAIPKQYLDKTMQLVLSKVPLPNMPYNSSGQNFLGIQGNSAVDNRWNTKIDHTLNAQHRFSVRYTEIPINNDNFGYSKSLFPVAYPTSISHTRQPAITFTSVLSPRIVNEFRANYMYGNYNNALPFDGNTKSYTHDYYNLPSTSNWGIPVFAGVNTMGSLGVNNTDALGNTRENQVQVADDLTMNIGKHTLTIGADLRRQQLNLMGDTGYLNGIYYFGTNTTNAGNSSAPGGIGGDPLASFMLGVPYQIKSVAETIPYYYRWKTYAGYVQDDYKVTRNLTLNFGLRYQYASPRSEKYNRQASIDLSNPVPLKNAQGQVTAYTLNYLYSGFGRSSYLEPAHKNGIEPRFGFAWKPDLGWFSGRQFVIRGGYGWSHLPQGGRSRLPVPDLGGAVTGYSNIYTQWTGSGPAPNSQAVNPGYGARLSTNQPVLPNNPIIEQVPQNGVLCAGCTPADPRVPAGTLYTFDSSAKLPYQQSWNVTIQREFGAGMVLTMSYLGSKGTHLYSPPLDVNYPSQTVLNNYLNQGLDPTAAVPDPFGRVTSTGAPLSVSLQQLARPYPTLSDILLAGRTTSNSIYHAGSAEIERRFAKGLGFRFNYTWAKSIDNTSDSNLDGSSVGTFGATYTQDPNNLGLERSVSTYDVRHRFNVVATYELPVGKGKPLFGNAGKLLNTLVGGWQVNGIETLRSGYPLSVVLGALNGFPAYPSSVGLHEIVRPDILPGVPILNPLWNKSVANSVPYINPAAFSFPAYNQLGNAPRTLDYARNPWMQTLDGSLMKSFSPFEDRSKRIQFRMEAYNALNHASLYMGPASGLFSGNPPVSSKGLSLAGPIPYYAAPGTYAAGSRQAVLAQYYNASFGKINQGQSTSGRVVQFALRLNW